MHPFERAVDIKGMNASPTTGERARASRPTARILIIVGRAEIRHMLRWRLDGAHEIVGELSDGCAAASEVEKTQADLVIVDHKLPTVNGAEVTRRIKARFGHVEVVGYTSAVDGSLESLLQAGADVAFAKDDLTSLLGYLDVPA